MTGARTLQRKPLPHEHEDTKVKELETERSQRGPPWELNVSETPYIDDVREGITK